MGLETGSFISDLVTTNPLGTDGKDQGDNHLRLIKSVLQGSFPNSDRAYHIPVALAAKVAAYPIVVADENSLIQVDATAGPLTATLPTVASVPDGWAVTVMKSDASANAVTTDGNGAETINGAASRTLTNQYNAETYMRDGSEWKVIVTGALDATLSAIAGLSPGADEMIYFTGADVAAVTTITLAGRNLIDDANVAAQQATLSLTPGTDVQIFDAVLEDLAALAVVALNEFIVGTGAGVYTHQSGATARNSLSLGAADTVAFGSLTLTTDLAITEGGTGSSTASAARIALGLEIGVDVQADLDVPSQAEAEAGTATIERVWTAQRVGQAVAALATITEAFESAEQVITLGSNHTVTHGLSALPTLSQVVLRCKTAELGFSIGDEVTVYGLDGAATSVNDGFTAAVDTTDIVLSVGSTALLVHRQSATIGDLSSITTGNWRFVVRAWL